MTELLFYMPDGGEAGVIQAWVPGDHKWVEFRGAPYSQWDDTPTPMRAIHDAMAGMHATVLHQDSILLIHDRHPDFPRVRALFESCS